MPWAALLSVALQPFGAFRVQKLTHPLLLMSTDNIGAVASVPGIGPGKTDHAVFLPVGKYTTDQLSKFSWILRISRGSTQRHQVSCPLASLKLETADWAEYVASLPPLSLHESSSLEDTDENHLQVECTGIEVIAKSSNDPVSRSVDDIDDIRHTAPVNTK